MSLEERLRLTLDDLRRIVTPWSCLGAMATGVLLLVGFLLLLGWARPPMAPAAPSTAVMNIIPALTATPVLPTVTPIPTLTATSAVPPPPQPGIIAIGSYVQVSGTGTDGLRLREEPGLGGKILFVGMESEVFRVDDGPRDADGYTWWYLVAPFDENRRGWAVSNYLAIAQNP